MVRCNYGLCKEHACSMYHVGGSCCPFQGCIRRCSTFPVVRVKWHDFSSLNCQAISIRRSSSLRNKRSARPVNFASADSRDSCCTIVRNGRLHGLPASRNSYADFTCSNATCTLPRRQNPFGNTLHCLNGSFSSIQRNCKGHVARYCARKCFAILSHRMNVRAAASIVYLCAVHLCAVLSTWRCAADQAARTVQCH